MNFLKKLLSLAVALLIANAGYCETISGQIKQDDYNIINQNQVVDSETQEPITGAAVSIPSVGYSSLTDENGVFEIDKQIKEKSILSVDKEGYRAFSLTIDKELNSNTIKLGIEKSKAGDTNIEGQLTHLGDDVFSETSANSSDFRIKSNGVFYSKKFNVKNVKMGQRGVIIIGSIIGLDTKLARELGQNRIAQVYSSPAEVYLNGQKIGELNINGDNQEIEIPRQLLKSTSELTIKTGRNLFQHAYIDYDDIEIAGIRFEIKEAQDFARK